MSCSLEQFPISVHSYIVRPPFATKHVVGDGTWESVTEFQKTVGFRSVSKTFGSTGLGTSVERAVAAVLPLPALQDVPQADVELTVYSTFCDPYSNLSYNQRAEVKRMRNERLCKIDDVAVMDLTELLQEAAHQIWPVNEDPPERFPSYRLALGQEPIQLGIIEFRILLFLASRPYHPFTRRCIADAVNSERDPVVEDTVDQHIASLLDQLGVFHDYVQSVPYIGFRFKA